jgi:hypothetical protein
MAAAQRLTDILILREQREQLELRRELRDAGKAVDTSDDSGQPETSPDVPESAEESVEDFLKRIGRTRTEETERVDE